VVKTKLSVQDEQDHDLLRTAERRLYPPLSDPNYLVLRSRRLIFSRWIEQLGREKLAILDVGGRYQPYRRLFGDRVGRYVAIDLIKTGLVDALADGQALPFAAGSFDVVIATQVMDYFREPGAAIKEIYSVLKPGGVFLASVPSCAPSFAENEYWRFTRPGLGALLSSFAEVEMVAELYSVGSLMRTANLALDTFVHYAAARWVYRRSACCLLNLLGLGVEKLKLTSNDQFTANYSVRAVKG